VAAESSRNQGGTAGSYLVPEQEESCSGIFYEQVHTTYSIKERRWFQMFIKVFLLLVFFAITISVGLYFRKRATNVNDFVLGGRAVGPWLTAFSFGATYF